MDVTVPINGNFSASKVLTVFCPICEVRFDYPLLEQHIATVHIGAKKSAQWSCGTCSYEAWDFNEIGLHCISMKHSPSAIRRLPENVDRYWTSMLDVLQKIATATTKLTENGNQSATITTVESRNTDNHGRQTIGDGDDVDNDDFTEINRSSNGRQSDDNNADSTMMMKNIVSILSSNPALLQQQQNADTMSLMNSKKHNCNNGNSPLLLLNQAENSSSHSSQFPFTNPSSTINLKSSRTRSSCCSLSPPSPKKRTISPPFFADSNKDGGESQRLSSIQDALLNLAAKYRLLQQQQRQKADGCNDDTSVNPNSSPATTKLSSPTFSSSSLGDLIEGQIGAGQIPSVSNVVDSASASQARCGASAPLFSTKGSKFTTASSSSGQQHHRSNPNNNIRKFDCHLCPFKSFSAATLRTHMNVHTKSRPFSCDFCGKCFNQSGNKYRHERRFCKVRRGEGVVGGLVDEVDEIGDLLGLNNPRPMSPQQTTPFSNNNIILNRNSGFLSSNTNNVGSSSGLFLHHSNNLNTPMAEANDQGTQQQQPQPQQQPQQQQQQQQQQPQQQQQQLQPQQQGNQTGSKQLLEFSGGFKQTSETTMVGNQYAQIIHQGEVSSQFSSTVNCEDDQNELLTLSAADDDEEGEEP